MVKSVLSKKPLVNSKFAMSTSLNQRSLLLCHSAIKSEKTRRQYDYQIKCFKEYFIIKSFDNLVEIEPKKLQAMIEDYVMYARDQGQGLSSIRAKLVALKLFFVMNDVILNWDKLRKMIPEKTKSTGDRPYTTKEIEILVKSSKTLRYKALMQFMASSGVRVGCFEELKMKHLKDMTNGCKSVLVYADTKDEYHTFIHQEAVEALDEYLEFRTRKGEIITPDSWVFCSPCDTTRPSSTESTTTTLSRHVKRSLGREESKHGRYEIMTCPGFRKRFITILKSNPSVNISLAEKLAGHSVTVPLDNSYFKPLLAQLFDEYQKVISELFIDDKYRLQSQIQSQQDEISLLQNKNNEIETLQKTILQIQNNMLELKTRHAS